MKHKNSFQWYVYLLVDPRDNKPFYVGKGKGRRMYQHAARVRRGVGDNAEKCARIRAIHGCGQEIEYRVSALFSDEQAAFGHEKELIAAHDGLTNVSSGCQDQVIVDREWAAGMLQRTLPFDVWYARHRPSMESILWYHRIVGELVGITRGTITIVREVSFDIQSNAFRCGGTCHG